MKDGKSLAIMMEIAKRNKAKKPDVEGASVKPQSVAREDKGYGAIITKGDKDIDMEDEVHSSIAEAIMARRKKYAEGGMVDLDDSATTMSHLDDDQEAAMKEHYDEDISQPLDSNEHGDDIDSDKHDKIARMMRMIRK